MTTTTIRRLSALLLTAALGLATGNVIANAADDGRSRTNAIVKCSAPLTEDAAVGVRLVVFERNASGDISRLVYRCSTP